MAEDNLLGNPNPQSPLESDPAPVPTGGQVQPPEPSPLPAAPLVPAPEPGPTHDLDAMQRELQELRGLRDQFQQTQQELGQYRQQQDALRQVFSPGEPEPDLATQIYTDPGRAFQQLEDRIVGRLQAEYQADQNRRGFWGTFYGEHKDLDGLDTLVEMTLRAQPALAQMDNSPESRAKLAEAVRAQGLALNQRFAGSANGQAPLRVVEPGRSPRAAASGNQAAPSEGPMTMAEMSRIRREQRRRGAAG